MARAYSNFMTAGLRATQPWIRQLKRGPSEHDSKARDKRTTDEQPSFFYAHAPAGDTWSASVAGQSRSGGGAGWAADTIADSAGRLADNASAGASRSRYEWRQCALHDLGATDAAGAAA